MISFVVVLFSTAVFVCRSSEQGVHFPVIAVRSVPLNMKSFQKILCCVVLAMLWLCCAYYLDAFWRPITLVVALGQAGISNAAAAGAASSQDTIGVAKKSSADVVYETSLFVFRLMISLYLLVCISCRVCCVL